jgi:PAS domain S-box-containing protein
MMSGQTQQSQASTESESHAIEVLFAGDDLPGGPTADDLAAEDEFAVRVSRDFVEARDRVEASDVDCAVVTHREDGFDGVAFLETVRRTHDEFPVVLVPATVDDRVASRAVAADATALVPATEPDSLGSIVGAIESNVSAYSREGERRMPISDLAFQAERRLKERALDEAPIGITISDATDPDQPIIYMNDSFAEITGYPHEEVVGVNHRFLQGPDTDPDRTAELAEGIAEKRNTQVVLRNYTKDGTEFWNQVNVSPIVDEHGEVTHYVGFQMDVTERRRAQRQLQAEREALDRLLDRVNGLANDVTETLVRAETRTEIEQLITERVGSGSEYSAAWLGRYDATEGQITVTEREDDRALGAETIDLDGDGQVAETLRETVETQEPTVLGEENGTYEIEDDETCVFVPLSYRSTTYGVLAVIEREASIDDRERVLLGSIGRSIGMAINATLTKRTITTDTVLTIGADLSDEDLFLVELTAATGAEFEHEAIIDDGRGRGILWLVSTESADVDGIVDRAEAHDDVLGAETLVTTDDESVLQFRLRQAPIVDLLSEYGASVASMHADANTLSLEFRIGTEDAARSLLDELEESYDHVELVAYHEEESRQTPQGFREELRNRLTDRQYTALRKAYVSGYFEWPRQVEGEQLAESMDIVPSTYHQHLQTAKRKLFEAFFDE